MVKYTRFLPLFLLAALLLLSTACGVSLDGNDDPGTTPDSQPTPAALQNPEKDDGNPTSPAPQADDDESGVPGPNHGQADVRGVVETFNTGNWKVTLYEGATPQMKEWFKIIKNLEPQNWPSFPNVDNPTVGFVAAHGLEYGLDERNDCPQEDCDILVDAGGYWLGSMDYDLGFVECHQVNNVGCALMMVNVGNETANLEQVVANNGWSVTGRYWHGDYLFEAIWGAMSHVVANMMNFVTDLNPGGNATNAGSNCSERDACDGVLARVVIMSGNQILVDATTAFDK